MAAPVRAAEAEAEGAPAEAEPTAPAEREAPAEGVTEPTVVWPAGVVAADEATTVWPPVPTVWAAPLALRQDVDDDCWTVTWAAYWDGQCCLQSDCSHVDGAGAVLDLERDARAGADVDAEKSVAYGRSSRVHPGERGRRGLRERDERRRRGLAAGQDADEAARSVEGRRSIAY